MVEKSQGKKHCKYEQVGTTDYFEQGSQRYMDAYVPMIFYPLLEFFQKKDKAGFDQGKYTSNVAAQKRLVRDLGYQLDECNGQEGVYADEREFKTIEVRFGVADCMKRMNLQAVDDPERAQELMDANAEAFAVPDLRATAAAEEEKQAENVEEPTDAAKPFAFATNRRHLFKIAQKVGIKPGLKVAKGKAKATKVPANSVNLTLIANGQCLRTEAQGE